jgi:uncharacterized protein (TIGR02145 family)
MKKLFILIVTVFFINGLTKAEVADTMYVMKSGAVVVKCPVADVDSVIFYKPTLQDIDGNNYTTVTIGTQTWMVENLKVTKLNDGTPIPNSGANAGVYTNAEWGALSSPARCWENHVSGPEPVGGNMLYNFYAINSGKLAPKGWHIPTKAEWETLAANVSQPNVIKLFDATCGGTNELGFKAIQAGCRYTEGAGGWYAEGNNSSFWASDSFSEGRGWALWLRSGSGTFDFGHSAYNYGFPVRLIKD